MKFIIKIDDIELGVIEADSVDKVADLICNEMDNPKYLKQEEINAITRACGYHLLPL